MLIIYSLGSYVSVIRKTNSGHIRWMYVIWGTPFLKIVPVVKWLKSAGKEDLLFVILENVF